MAEMERKETEKERMLRILERATRESRVYGFNAIRLCLEHPDWAKEFIDSVPIATLD